MVTKTEIIWKKILELDPDSRNYWTNFFNFADILFSPQGVEDKEQKKINIKNRDRLRNDLIKIMNYFKQGTFIPNFFIIQHTLFNMQDGDYVKVKSESGITKIYKVQLLNELEKIKSWIFTEMGNMPVRFSSTSLNVVNM